LKNSWHTKAALETRTEMLTICIAKISTLFFQSFVYRV